jgi:hypothetical protein
LLEELHGPCEDARKKWAVKLPDLLKPQSSSMQEAESPEGHISAAIQHLDEAARGEVRGAAGELAAVSSALDKAKEAKNKLIEARPVSTLNQPSTQPSKGGRTGQRAARNGQMTTAPFQHGGPFSLLQVQLVWVALKTTV